MALRAKSPKKAKPSRPQIVVFGAAGVGKTWAAVDWPNCYYIDCEGGANLTEYTDKLDQVGALYLGPEDGANDFDVVLGEVQTLSASKHDRKTLVIDSISKLFNTAVQIEHDKLTDQGKKTDFGVDKKPAISKMRKLIRLLERLDMNVILIAHEKAIWKDGEQRGETYDCWDRLGYELNLVVQVVKTGPSRKARVVKSRFSQFQDGSMVDWSYDEFAERFGRDVTEGDCTAIELATPEQLTAINELSDFTKLDDEQRLKWFEKAGVDCWEDMPTEMLQKCIDHLKAKLPATV